MLAGGALAVAALWDQTRAPASPIRSYSSTVIRRSDSDGTRIESNGVGVIVG
jgi:hypothetical protein